MANNMTPTDKILFDEFANILKNKQPPTAIPEMFEGKDERILAGLAVYRNNVRSSLSTVLGDTFPVVKQLVGEEFFKFLAHEYFHTHPPKTCLVRHYGDALPAFLETFEPTQSYPYLPDVARVEIAWLTAYHAADAKSMEPTEILSAAGDDIIAARFALHPSTRLLSSPYAAASIWQAHQKTPSTDVMPDANKAECTLILRPHTDVIIRVITKSAFVALQSLSSGERMETAINKAAETNESFDPQGFFKSLFEYKIIAGIRP